MTFVSCYDLVRGLLCCVVTSWALMATPVAVLGSLGNRQVWAEYAEGGRKGSGAPAPCIFCEKGSELGHGGRDRTKMVGS